MAEAGGRGKLLAGLWACWVVGVALSAALAWEHHKRSHTGGGAGLPGCGAGGACEKVLDSPYGKLGGISVTWFALGYYALLVPVLWWAGSTRPARQFVGSLALPVVAALGLATAGWSMSVMVGKLHQVCPYCAVVHLANTLFFLFSGAVAQQAWLNNQQQRQQQGLTPLGAKMLAAVVGLGLGLAVWQITFLSVFHDPVDLKLIASGQAPLIGTTADPGPVLWTIEGPQSASRRVLMFACFTCENCREAHDLLREIRHQSPEPLRVDLRMVPLASPCNPQFTVESTENEHKYACALARIALAVAEVEADKFGEFAEWLFEHQGQTPFEAETEAVRRVDGQKFREALDSSTEAGRRVDARLAADLRLSETLGLERVPQIYVGRPGSPTADRMLSGVITREKLQELFQSAFDEPVGLQQVP